MKPQLIHIVNITGAYNIDDLRRIAHSRLPRVAYDDLARGAEDDVTMTGTREALANLRFQPRVLADI